MKSNRLWAIGTVIIVAAVVGLGWILGISPKLAEAAQTSTAADQVDAENLSLQQQIIALKAAYENIDIVREELDGLEESMPPTDDLPDFIREINTLANKNGVTIDAITLGAYDVFVSSSASAIPEVAAAEASMGESLVKLKMTLKFTGSDTAIVAFNEDLQTGDGRLFLVTNFVVQEGTSTTQPPPVETVDGEVVEETEVTFNGEVSGFLYIVINPNVEFDADEEVDVDTGTETPTPTPTPTEPTPTPTETVSALRR